MLRIISVTGANLILFSHSTKYVTTKSLFPLCFSKFKLMMDDKTMWLTHVKMYYFLVRENDFLLTETSS